VFRLVAVNEPNVRPEMIAFKTQQYLLLRSATAAAK